MSLHFDIIITNGSTRNIDEACQYNFLGNFGNE